MSRIRWMMVIVLCLTSVAFAAEDEKSFIHCNSLGVVDAGYSVDVGSIGNGVRAGTVDEIRGFSPKVNLVEGPASIAIKKTGKPKVCEAVVVIKDRKNHQTSATLSLMLNREADQLSVVLNGSKSGLNPDFEKVTCTLDARVVEAIKHCRKI